MVPSIKQIAIKRKIRAFLEKRKDLEPLKIRSVGIIVDTEGFPDSKDFLNFKKTLSAEELAIVDFSTSKKKNETGNTNFTYRDIGITGNIKNEEIKVFAEKEFELLINYTKRSEIAFNLLTAASRARFKVGIDPQNEAFYDLIIQTEIEDGKAFERELLKYLKILKLLRE